MGPICTAMLYGPHLHGLVVKKKRSKMDDPADLTADVPTQKKKKRIQTQAPFARPRWMLQGYSPAVSGLWTFDLAFCFARSGPHLLGHFHFSACEWAESCRCFQMFVGRSLMPSLFLLDQHGVIYCWRYTFS